MASKYFVITSARIIDTEISRLQTYQVDKLIKDRVTLNEITKSLASEAIRVQNQF